MTSSLVVLGGTGFVGSAIASAFERAEPSLSARRLGSADADLATAAGADWLTCEVGPEARLIHAARVQDLDGIAEFARNVAMCANVARAVRAARPRHCTYLSSNAVYGDTRSNLRVSETTRLAPSGFYAASKLAGELVLRTTAQEAGIPLLVLRPSMVVGPGDRSRAYGPNRFALEAIEGKPIRVYGDGADVRQYTYARDLAEVTVALVNAGETGVFDVAAPEALSVSQVLVSVEELLGRQVPVERVARRRPKTRIRMTCARLQRTLPAFRFTPFREALRTTIEFHRQGLESERFARG